MMLSVAGVGEKVVQLGSVRVNMSGNAPARVGFPAPRSGLGFLSPHNPGVQDPFRIATPDIFCFLALVGLGQLES